MLGLAILAAVGLAVAPSLAENFPKREPVALPADVKAIFLAQMLGHVVSLDAIVTALGRGDYTAAAREARDELGVTRFQKSDGSQEEGPNLGIGKHLPEGFRAIGKRFREAAKAFAEQAEAMPDAPSADEERSLVAAFAKVTNECRACHDSFRIE